jgi:hypothetical protein
MGCYIWLVAAGPLFGALSTFGVLSVDTSFLMWIDAEGVRNLVRLVLAVAPFAVFMVVYQQKAASPFKARWLPAIGVVFTAYTYTMLVSQIWAISRLFAGQGGWAKTARVASKAAV